MSAAPTHRALSQLHYLGAVAILLTMTTSILAMSQQHDIWPQWRGPNRDGQVQGETWPDRLSPNRLKEVWRVGDLGPSYCGPIVSETMVYTAETRDRQDELVQAYDRTSGEKIWEASWSGAMKVPFFAAKNGSWMRATPALDGDRLFVGGMRDVLVCLSAKNGEQIWKVDFVNDLGTKLPDFGFVSSPLVDGDSVYVQAGGGLYRLNKDTGEVIWTSLDDGGGMMGSAFSSPILTTIAGERQLIVLMRENMHGVRPESGEVLWTMPIRAFRGMNILTPVTFGDAVFTATYGGRSQLLDITPADESSTINVKKRWDRAVQGYMTSPVVINGHAYFFTRGNRFTCLRLEDGEACWTSGPTGNEYWSLVAQGDRILALSNSGNLRLIEANPDEYQVIDNVQVSEAQTWAHLAIADHDLIIREQSGLVAYRWE